MSRKTYRVTGPFATYDTEPGGTFTKSLDPEHEAQLLEQGAIEVVTEKKTKADTKPSSSSGTDSGGGS